MGRPIKTKKLESAEKGEGKVVVERKKPRYHPGTVRSPPPPPGGNSMISVPLDHCWVRVNPVLGSNQAKTQGSHQSRECGSDGVFPKGHPRSIRGGSTVVKERHRSTQGSGRSKSSSYPRPRFDTRQSCKQKDAEQWSPRRRFCNHSRTGYTLVSSRRHHLSSKRLNRLYYTRIGFWWVDRFPSFRTFK